MTPTDPDPTATELARVVAWLRARADKYDEDAMDADDSYEADLDEERAWVLRDAARGLERGEEP